MTGMMVDEEEAFTVTLLLATEDEVAATAETEDEESVAEAIDEASLFT